MKINKIAYSTSILISILALFTGCVKDDLYNTPHPGTARISVTADWSARGEGVDIPPSWTVVMGGYSGIETGATHNPDYLFASGDYTLTAYDTPEGISIDGTLVTVAADTHNAGCIIGQPGWLFTSIQQIHTTADTYIDLTATMRQQMRLLTLTIEPAGDTAGRIANVTGTLGGVAGTLDFSTGTHGTPSDVALTFTKVAEGADAGKWQATVRLLGISGDAQRLTGTIRFSDSNPQSVALESDLTIALADFNDSKTVPLVLSGTVVETPSEAGVTATIVDWNTIHGDPVEAM